MTTDESGNEPDDDAPLEPFDLQFRIILDEESPEDPLPFEEAVILSAVVLSAALMSVIDEPRTEDELRACVAGSPRFDALAPLTIPLVEWIRANGITHRARVGQAIAERCVGDAARRPALVGPEIERLVALSLAVAFALTIEDEPLAVELRNHTWYEGESITNHRSRLDEALLRALGKVERLPSADHIDAAAALYDRAIVELSADHRIHLMQFVVQSLMPRPRPLHALYAFLFRDPDEHVVATTAQRTAAIWPTHADDPLAGVRELAEWACALASRDPLRAAAVFGGLLRLDDRRVYDLVGPCWRLLPPAMHDRLLLLSGSKRSAPWIEWLLTWIENCAGARARLLDWYLLAFPIDTGSDGVTEQRSALPAWSDPTATRPTIVQRWEFDEYASRLRSRLLAIAANARDPDHMLLVLKNWRIEDDSPDSAPVFRILREARERRATGGQRPGGVIADGASSTTDAPAMISYRERHARATAAHEAGVTDEIDAESLSLTRFILRQLARAEQALGGVPDGTKAVRHLMYASWPIGYLHGRLGESVKRLRLEDDSPAYDQLETAVYDAALPGLVSLELTEFRWCGRVDPEYVEGIRAAIKETVNAVLTAAGRRAETQLLARWLVTQGRQGVR